MALKTQEFTATHYDPYDPNQTRPGGEGIGAFNKKVEWGDVAMGQRKYAQGTLIKIPELADVSTPYGKGVFRINDKKNKRYSVPKVGENFDIAVPSTLPNAKDLRKRIGSSKMNFIILPSDKQIKRTIVQNAVKNVKPWTPSPIKKV